MTTRKEDTNTGDHIDGNNNVTVNPDDNYRNSKRLINKTFEKAKDNIQLQLMKHIDSFQDTCRQLPIIRSK